MSLPTWIKHHLADPCQRQWHQAQSLGWDIDKPDVYCSRCGASINIQGVTKRGCVFCVNHKLPWQSLCRLTAYHPPMSDWILSMKFGRQWRWGTHLGKIMGQQWDSRDKPDQMVVCPVPMHWLRRWHRGFNQTHLIASSLGKICQWPMASLLKRTRHTPPQTHVAPSRRAANVRGSVAPRTMDLAGWSVLLVDDVKTSGSTLKACCGVLKSMGAVEIHVAVAAVADPKNSNFTDI